MPLSRTLALVVTLTALPAAARADGPPLAVPICCPGVKSGVREGLCRSTARVEAVGSALSTTV